MESDFNNAFYCPIDSVTYDGVTYDGVIVLPATTMQKMWNGDIFGNQAADYVGDFAAAYIMAHEFGHHIVDEFYEQLEVAGLPMPEITGANGELLADCFAGAWTNYAFDSGVLTDTDYDEAIRAASLIGDQPGTVDPHGTAEQRVQALRIGAELGANDYPAGNPGACTTSYWK